MSMSGGIFRLIRLLNSPEKKSFRGVFTAAVVYLSALSAMALGACGTIYLIGTNCNGRQNGLCSDGLILSSAVIVGIVSGVITFIGLLKVFKTKLEFGN